MKKWLCMALCAGMMFGAAACGGNTTGKVENKEITISLPYGERTGIYSGDMVDGIPEGHGKFESENTEGTAWTYEGSFVAGVFEGEGKTVWENGLIQTGTYKGGNWQASELGLLDLMESQDAIRITDESRKFIKENPEFFPVDDLGKIIDFVDESIMYKMVTKEPSKYGDKILKINDLYVIQIDTVEIYDSEKYTYAIMCDEDINIYQIFMIGELPDIYEGDSIKELYGVPVGNDSYDAASGGFVNSVVIAPCWVQK